MINFGFAGGEVEGFMLETKRRNQFIEERTAIPGYDEFSTSRTCGEARFRAEAGKTGHPSSTTTSYFSHWSASMPRRGSCRGIIYILVWQLPSIHIATTCV